MTKIVGIAGSLRQGSYNSGLLRAAAGVMPEGASLEIVSIAEIPLYNADEESAYGIPASVEKMKQAMIGADGVLLATPEYNNGIPGVFKNAIDWASRPPADIPKVFRNKPFAVMGASPGGFGTILSQNGWLPILRTLGTDAWFGGRLMVSRAGKAFSEDGELVDDAVRDQLRAFVDAFVHHIRNRSH